MVPRVHVHRDLVTAQRLRKAESPPARAGVGRQLRLALKSGPHAVPSSELLV